MCEVMSNLRGKKFCRALLDEKYMKKRRHNIFIANEQYDDYDNEFVPPEFPKTEEEICVLKEALRENFLTSAM